MTKFPTEIELKKARAALEKTPGSRMLPANASAVERLKFSLCEQFVSYLLVNKLTQRELAEKIGIDEALVSKIVHYHFGDFTTDRLMNYLSVLYPRVEVKISVA